MIYYLDYPPNRVNYRITPLGDNYIESLYKKIVPDKSLVIFNSTPPFGFVEWWSNTVIPLLAKHDISCVVWDLASNPISVDHYNTVNNLNHPLPYYCCVGNFNIHQTQLPEKMMFFPFWAYWSSFRPTEEFKLNRTYKLSSLNGNDWSHRKYAYILLSKKSYFNQMIFTFGIRKTQFDFLNSLVLSDQDLEEFNKLPQTVTYNQTDHAANLDIDISHPAFQDTYVNLVNETSISNELAIVSEKTFKPIRAHQLFVIIATVGAVKFLRDIGFDVFDDIIDHSYDMIQNEKLRIEMAIQQLDRLSELDLTKLFIQLQPRLEKNAKWLTSDEFRQQFWLNFS